MTLQGSILVVSETSATGLTAPLSAAGAFPVVEASWAEAASAVATVQPAAIVVAEAGTSATIDLVEAAMLQIDALGGPWVPLIARITDDEGPLCGLALPIAATAPVTTLIARLAAALRVRALHSTVLRRSEALRQSGAQAPPLSNHDPLDDATVLVAGRGGRYPALTVAVGERAGLVGALSLEAALNHLGARDVDGVVIGDGFSTRAVESFIATIGGDPRFQDLPVILLDAASPVREPRLANLEHVNGDPALAVELVMPLVGAHAFGARLRRMLASLDAKGLIDPDTGLLTQPAFMRDLERTIADAQARSLGLCLARISIEGAEHRTVVDAARIMSRLVRATDYACLDADDAILMTFTETDLRTAHVVARRIASVLKHTTMSPDRDRTGVDPSVALATLKGSDTLASLLARVRPVETVAAE